MAAKLNTPKIVENILSREYPRCPAPYGNCKDKYQKTDFLDAPRMHRKRYKRFSLSFFNWCRITGRKCIQRRKKKRHRHTQNIVRLVKNIKCKLYTFICIIMIFLFFFFSQALKCLKVGSNSMPGFWFGFS